MLVPAAFIDIHAVAATGKCAGR